MKLDGNQEGFRSAGVVSSLGKEKEGKSKTRVELSSRRYKGSDSDESSGYE